MAQLLLNAVILQVSLNCYTGEENTDASHFLGSKCLFSFPFPFFSDLWCLTLTSLQLQLKYFMASFIHDLLAALGGDWLAVILGVWWLKLFPRAAFLFYLYCTLSACLFGVMYLCILVMNTELKQRREKKMKQTMAKART